MDALIFFDIASIWIETCIKEEESTVTMPKRKVAKCLVHLLMRSIVV